MKSINKKSIKTRNHHLTIILFFSFIPYCLADSRKNQTIDFEMNNLFSTISYIEESKKIDNSLSLLEIQHSIDSNIKLNKDSFSEINNNLLNLEKRAANINFDFIIPFLNSIVAAFIFWIVFSYIPTNRRKKQVRKKINLHLFKITLRIKLIINICTQYKASYGGYINYPVENENDLALSLNNKCFNENFLYYTEIKENLICIGPDLYNQSEELLKEISQTFQFSEYLTEKEIMIIDNIRIELEKYDIKNYDRNPVSLNADRTTYFYPSNPSLSYLSKSLYNIFKKIDAIEIPVLKDPFLSRDIFFASIKNDFKKCNYKICLKKIKIYKKKIDTNENLLTLIQTACYLKLNRVKDAKETLKNTSEHKMNLFHWKDIIGEYLESDKYRDLFLEYYSDDDVLQMYEIDNKIKNEIVKIKKQADYLENYYKEKI